MVTSDGAPAAQALAVTLREDGLLVGVRVSPSAPLTALRGIYGGRLKVSVGAPPEDNRANRLLVAALAKWLEIRQDEVRIESGHGSRDKVVALKGIAEVELRSKVGELLPGEQPMRGE